MGSASRPLYLVETALRNPEALFSTESSTLINSETLLEDYRDKIDTTQAKYVGAGASGKVFRYTTEKNGFIFAYKDIRITQSDEESVKSAREEYAALIRQERVGHPHPNIVTVLEYVETPTLFRIFMEYCEEGSLLDYFEERKKLGRKKLGLPEIQDIVSIIFQINNALLFCHHGIFQDGFPGKDTEMETRAWEGSIREYVLHRDLKPANILLVKDERISPFLIKLADFGHAVIVEDRPPGSVTAPPSSAYRGTDIYRAPEINDPPNGKVSWSSQCDMFSFGCIIYELLHSEKPLQSPMMMNTPKISLGNEILEHFGAEDKIIPDIVEHLLLRDGTKRVNARKIFAIFNNVRKYRLMLECAFLSPLWKVYQNERSKSGCKRVQFNIEKIPPCCENEGKGHEFDSY